MRILTFSTGDTGPRLGLVMGDNILDVPMAYTIVFEATPPEILVNLKSLIESGDRGLKLLHVLHDEISKELKSGTRTAELLMKKAVYSIESIKFHPPVLNPEKTFYVAVNYWSHAREMGVEPPESPYFFLKPPNSLIAHGDPVIIPRGSIKLDHEVELAVVIGRRGKYISRNEAMEYVFGYTIANDVSLRDKQIPMPRLGIRWLHAKGFDTAAPIGPWIVTGDEIEDPHNLRLELRVNGELRQEGNTGDMIFKAPELIEAVSQGLTLKPGDIISTGTPSGVGAATGKFLNHGDVMVARVEKIGDLINTVSFEF